VTIDRAMENHLKNLSVIVDTMEADTKKRISQALTELKKINKDQVWAGQCAPKGTTGAYQTLFSISDPPDNKRLGMPSPRYQVDCYSPDYTIAKRMADLTYNAFDGFFGIMGGNGGILVEQATYQDTEYDYEQDTKLHHFWVDVVVMYHV